MWLFANGANTKMPSEARGGESGDKFPIKMKLSLTNHNSRTFLKLFIRKKKYVFSLDPAVLLESRPNLKRNILIKCYKLS